MPIAWMRQWSWAIAMSIAIFITVGGLVTLESGRENIAHEYEIALEAKNAAATLSELSAAMAGMAASERGYLLTGAPDQVDGYRAALARARRAAAELGQYYQADEKAGDAAPAREFAAVRAALEQRAAHAVDVLGTARGEPGHVAAVQDAPPSPGRAASLAGAPPGPSHAALREVRDGIEGLLARENRRAQQAMDASRADQRVATLCVAAVSALNIVLFVLLFRNLGIQIDRQRREQQKLLITQGQLDRLVRERTGQLEALATHLQTVSEDEKTALARELHDELGSILTASKMDVAWVRGRLAREEPAYADKLTRAMGYLDQGIALKRRIIEDMRPTVLTNFGLPTALRTLAEEAAQRHGWRLDLTLPAADIELDEAVSIALFRVAQESLNNAAKYARASVIAVALERDERNITLSIADNGVGIAAADMRRTKTHGLLGMKQRVAAQGGSLEISAARPRGTRVRVVLPADAHQGAAAQA